MAGAALEIFIWDLSVRISRPANDHALDWTSGVAMEAVLSAATPLTLSCAVVSWHVVERWFLHSVRRKTFEPRTVETEQIHCLVNGSRKLPLTKAFQLIEYKTCRALASEVPLTKERMLTSLGQISRGKGSSILQGPSRLALTGKVSGLARSVRRSSNWRIRH